MYSLYYLKSNVDDKIYLGITNNPSRRYYQHINYTVEARHHNGNWIRKVLNKGGKIKMNIIISGLTKSSAIILEKKFIEFFRKVINKKLTNTSDGGLGFNHRGIPHSEEHKKSIEAAQPHKVRIPKDILYELYINQSLSKKKIANIYDCGPTTIDRRLIEYNIKTRTTINYKISYKVDKNEILDMYLNKKMTISNISKTLGVGYSAVRCLIQREKIDTSRNKFSKKCDLRKIKLRYDELIKTNIKKMKIYEIMSSEFNLSKGYLSRLKIKEL